MKYMILMTLLITVSPEKSYSQYLDLITGKHVSRNDSPALLKYENITANFHNEYMPGISKNLSKYKYISTLNTGTALNNTNKNYNSNFILEGRFLYFFSEKNTAGAEITYVSFNGNSFDYAEYGSGYTGGKLNYFDFIINAQAGTFERDNIVDIYANVGLGIHLNQQNSSMSTYYSFNDSNYFSSTNPSSLTVYPVVQIGGGLIIKPNYNFGINLEVDMNAYGFQYIFIPTEAYFPVKAGFTYYFMK